MFEDNQFLKKMKASQFDFSSDSKFIKKQEEKLSTDSYFEERASVIVENEKKFSLRELFQGVFSKLYPLFAIDCGALILYDKGVHHITRTYLFEANAKVLPYVETISDPVSFSLIRKEISGFDFPVLKSRREWIDDFGENHCLPNHPKEYYFHCYIPLAHQGRILGTFELHNHNRELSAEGLAFCCNIADFLTGLLAVMEHRTEATGGPENLPTEQIMCTSCIRLAEKLSKTNEPNDLVYKIEEPTEIYSYPEILGNSAEMRQVYKLLNRISSSETTVLILGETGTGKELIAKAIHDGSERKHKNMIKVNCAAIPPNLIESELFGHEKGSFTGATKRRIGKFEQAHKSTIFLDEIGELPLNLQVKLLRVLQEKEIERVGGKTAILTDVRIISATNRNLLEEVEAGRFRRDLFYRLNVFPVTLPPLRARKTDIPGLAAHFLEKFAKKSNRALHGFSKKAISRMMTYGWPGNVRELEHLIEREVVMAQGSVINDIEIPSGTKLSVSTAIAPVKTIFENERDHIFSVLELCNGKISGPNGAAKLLGVPATTLNSKIKRLGLAKKHIF